MVSVASLLDKNCWASWPRWECYGTNVIGFVQSALLFIFLVPQIYKNFRRRSVAGLSFLWAVGNFTASIVNLIFVFHVPVPVFSVVASVYMPVLELVVLFQFFVYVPKPYTTKLLLVLVCLITWSCLVELELNLPEAIDKMQWVATVLWGVQLIPQILLNIELQSTSGLSTASVLINMVSRTASFLTAYGLNIPLQYVVMSYYASTCAFIITFQLFYYGKDNGGVSKMEHLDRDVEAAENEEREVNTHQENQSPDDELLDDESCSLPVPDDQGKEEVFVVAREGSQLPIYGSIVDTRDENQANSQDEEELLEGNKKLMSSTYSQIKSILSLCFGRRVLMAVRVVFIAYLIAGLFFFAIALYLRTMTYVALLGPIGSLLVIVSATEYYNLKRKGHLRRIEEVERKLKAILLDCKLPSKSNLPAETYFHDADTVQ